MDVRIRSEKVSDYAKIAEINAVAFSVFLQSPLETTYLSEVSLVDGLRHGATFDQELSLVAEVDGNIIGHVLFYPFESTIGGEPLQALSLAPIAVHPAFQKRGIGSNLIEEGHCRGVQRGYSFAFLLGHPSYYPRFGYQTEMFGEGWIEIERVRIPNLETDLQERMVQPEDIETLVRWWKYWFEDVDLALFPGTALMDWVTHSGGIMSTVVTQNGEMIGYLRYAMDKPSHPKLFLAKDRSAVNGMLDLLNKKVTHRRETSLRLPLHPDASGVKACIELPYKGHLKTWEAAMIKILDEECQVVEEYCSQVGEGVRSPGLLIYPPSVEFA
jgi:predicted N-acetyltransferase YhbS